MAHRSVRQGWLRRRLTPTESTTNRIARGLFTATAITMVIAFALSALAVFVGEAVQWAFTILFWLALLLSIPAFCAVLATGRSD